MKPYSYYTAFTAEFPNKSTYTIKYYYKGGKLICIKKPFCPLEEIPESAVEETVFDEDGYELHCQAWLKEKLRLEEEFKKDLMEVEQVSDKEKADKCFALAWDYGCSQGLEAVHEYFSELVELIK